MSSPSLALDTLVYIAIFSWLLYLGTGGLYRLYFHPLTKFSGPKLAALTGWCKFHHEIIHRGRFIWKLQELHDRQGPIVPG